MLSSWYPLNSIENYELNTLWGRYLSQSYIPIHCSGVVHSLAQCSRASFNLDEQSAHRFDAVGFGSFNVVEGIVNHHALGIHHVNETIDPFYRRFFDVAFVVWGALMLVFGYILLRQKPSTRLDSA
jgi:uncharacterized membrane protein